MPLNNYQNIATFQATYFLLQLDSQDIAVEVIVRAIETK